MFVDSLSSEETDDGDDDCLLSKWLDIHDVENRIDSTLSRFRLNYARGQKFKEEDERSEIIVFVRSLFDTGHVKVTSKNWPNVLAIRVECEECNKFFRQKDCAKDSIGEIIVECEGDDVVGVVKFGVCNVCAGKK
jgi:hypothetical protein